MGASGPTQLDASSFAAVVRSKSRVNGWSWPPHPLQFVAWGILVYFALFYFTTTVPSFLNHWHPPTYALVAVLFLVHVVLHVIAVSINPADPAVLNKIKHGDREVPSFDRKKHRHVIEDSVCHLCQLAVSPGSKHCSACNKCVGNFDHHCKWLNNCVGSRNYRFFISTLVSALVGCVAMASLTLLQFVAYFTDKDTGGILKPYHDLLDFEKGRINSLNIDVHASSNSTTITADTTRNQSSEPVFRLVYGAVDPLAWLILTAFTSLLHIAAIALLAHLFAFHCYLMYQGITTYDYIVAEREKAEEKARELEASSQLAASKHMGNRVVPHADSYEMNTERSIHSSSTVYPSPPVGDEKDEVTVTPTTQLDLATPHDSNLYSELSHQHAYMQDELSPSYRPPRHHPCSEHLPVTRHYSTAAVERRKRRRKKRSASHSPRSTADHKLSVSRHSSEQDLSELHGDRASKFLRDSDLDSGVGQSSVSDVALAVHRQNERRYVTPSSPDGSISADGGATCRRQVVEPLVLPHSSDSESHTVVGLPCEPVYASTSPSYTSTGRGHSSLPTLPPLTNTPLIAGNVQASGPAGLYNSDSAESLVEVNAGKPVKQQMNSNPHYQQGQSRRRKKRSRSKSASRRIRDSGSVSAGYDNAAYGAEHDNVSEGSHCQKSQKRNIPPLNLRRIHSSDSSEEDYRNSAPVHKQPRPKHKRKTNKSRRKASSPEHTDLGVV